MKIYLGWGLLGIALLLLVATALVFVLPAKWADRLDSWALVLAAIMMGWSAWQQRHVAHQMKEQYDEMKKQAESIESIKRMKAKESTPRVYPKRHDNL